MDKQSITFSTLWRSWRTYAIRLLMTIPEDGLAELEGRERRKRRNGAWVLWALVGVLAIASITNLADRAYTHKAGFSANVVGAGLALLVPVAVHYAIKVRGWWQVAIWSAAILFASISATIQYQIYAPENMLTLLSKENLEALAFGAGVPLAECVLAGIAAVVLRQDAQREADNELKTAQALAAEEERERERERDDQLFAVELENKRLDAQAKREERLLKAQAKMSKAVQSSVQQAVQGVDQSTASTPPKTQTEDEQRHLLETQLLDNGWTGASALARATNLSRSTVYNRLNEMAERGRVRNENGKWDIVRDVVPALPEQPAIHLNGVHHES